MSCLPGGRSGLRALLKAAHLHAHINFQGLVALIHGLIALSGVTSGVPLQYCQLVLHQLCVVRCRGGLLRVPLSVIYLEGRQGHHVSSAYCQKSLCRYGIDVQFWAQHEAPPRAQKHAERKACLIRTLGSSIAGKAKLHAAESVLFRLECFHCSSTPSCRKSGPGPAQAPGPGPGVTVPARRRSGR